MNTTAAIGSRPGRASAFLRRMGANAFDAILLFAVWLLAAAPLAIAFAVAHRLDSPALQMVLRGYLPLVGFAYFGRAWIKNGQTFGMRAWRLTVRAAHGRLGIARALARYALALVWWVSLGEGLMLAFRGHELAAALPLAVFAAGYFWIFLDPEAQSLHDRLSGTRVLFTPKSAGARQEPQTHEAKA